MMNKVCSSVFKESSTVMAEYKIKDIEVLTGIKAHTIRIWEKRYGILVPERTDTQIRTYSDHDLSYLLNISLLNKHGHKISKIAELSIDEIHGLVWDIKMSRNANYTEEKLILALLHLDEQLFADTLQVVIEEKGLEKTFSEDLIPFLDRIGVMWLVNSISAAQEHFISNLIRQKLIAAIDKQPVPTDKSQAFMLYLPEHDWHEIGLLFYQYLLRSKGFHTVYLGQSLPYESLLDCIERIQPKAIISSWLTAIDKPFIITYFKQLKQDAPHVELFAGGAQINLHAMDLKGLVTEIKNAESLLSHFVK
ncbi:MAG: MerR family transcriptional regulator [Flavobacteriales bacterium]